MGLKTFQVVGQGERRICNNQIRNPQGKAKKKFN